MSSNRTVIINTVCYIALFIIMALSYRNTKFDNDPAGNGMARGLTFVYGLGILFAVAIGVTVFNAFFYRGITQLWVKLFFFIPIALPVIIFAHEVLEIGKPRPPGIHEQAHTLTIEIRTTKQLKDATFAFRTSGGGSFSKLQRFRREGKYFIYEKNNAIFYESDRKFYIKSDEFVTEEYSLSIPYQPEDIPFTKWHALSVSNDKNQNPVNMEYRYKITK